jgi:hypothetical protein
MSTPLHSNANSLAHFYGEYYFFLVLRQWDWETGSAVLAGVTTPDVLRDRIRHAAIGSGRADELLAASKNGKSETFAQRWERFYGIPFYADETQPLAETCDDIS